MCYLKKHKYLWLHNNRLNGNAVRGYAGNVKYAPEKQIFFFDTLQNN